MHDALDLDHDVNNYFPKKVSQDSSMSPMLMEELIQTYCGPNEVAED